MCQGSAVGECARGVRWGSVPGECGEGQLRREALRLDQRLVVDHDELALVRPAVKTRALCLPSSRSGPLPRHAGVVPESSNARSRILLKHGSWYDTRRRPLRVRGCSGIARRSTSRR